MSCAYCTRLATSSRSSPVENDVLAANERRYVAATEVVSNEMNAPKRTEQYEGTVVQVGNSRGMRLPAGFFSAHPEFREGKVKVTVVAEGQVLVSAVTKRPTGQRAEAADPDQLRRIGKLFEGVIVYAWLNDDRTLRKQGVRSDVYAVFRRMLERGEVPSSIDDLLRASTEMD